MTREKTKYNKKTAIIVVLVLVALLLVGILVFNKPNDCTVVNGRKVCPSEYIGLTTSEAVERAKEDRLTAKYVRIDDNSNPFNTSVGGTPIYLIIEDNKVTDASLQQL